MIVISNGQGIMHIYQKGGITNQFLVNNVDSIIFSDLVMPKVDSVTDIDGNVYHTVTIGVQVWMIENLKTTKYRDGTSIPEVTDDTQWIGLTTGAYCDYNNTVSDLTSYGRLYNWYTVSDSRSIAPIGWHVAMNADWTTLTTYLGGENLAGGKLKESGTTHWLYPNAGATNESGFLALPGGCRDELGRFSFLGDYGLWWGSTEYSATSAFSRYMSFGGTIVSRAIDKKNCGFSVRCVRDL